jgi:hypothetical protein
MTGININVEPSRRRAWFFVFLVFLFMLINWADKAARLGIGQSLQFA